jgi:Holliday junction resolvase RusA-like endonuclease
VSSPVTICLLGEPVPFARTRHNGAQHFLPQKQRNTAAAFRLQAQQAMLHSGAPAFDEPLCLEMVTVFSIPRGWSQSKRNQAIMGNIRPGKRPDIDNLYKLVADAMNAIVYRDDALIVEARLRKVYGPTPKTVVTVAPVSAGWRIALAHLNTTSLDAFSRDSEVAHTGTAG